MFDFNITIYLTKEPKPDKYIQFHINNGYINSTCVLQYNKNKNMFLSDKKIIEYQNSKIELCNYYKNKYPNYNFIPMDDIDTFLKNESFKIINPKEYKKDIPNVVIDYIIDNPLMPEDIKENEYELVGIEDLAFINWLGKEKPIFTQTEINDIFLKYSGHKYLITNWTHKAQSDTWLYCCVKKQAEEKKIKIDDTLYIKLYWYKSVIEHVYNNNVNVIKSNKIKSKLSFIFNKKNEKDYYFIYCKGGILLINF